MGIENISLSVKRIMDKLQKQRINKEYLKGIFTQGEYRHIKQIRQYREKLFVYTDSAPAMFSVRIKKEEVLKEVKKTAPEIEKIIVKIGS